MTACTSAWICYVERCVLKGAALTCSPRMRRLLDLYGLTAFLRLAPLDDRGLFMRTLDRPVKAGDPIGLAHLQVPCQAADQISPLVTSIPIQKVLIYSLASGHIRCNRTPSPHPRIVVVHPCRSHMSVIVMLELQMQTMPRRCWGERHVGADAHHRHPSDQSHAGQRSAPRGTAAAAAARRAHHFGQGDPCGLRCVGQSRSAADHPWPQLCRKEYRGHHALLIVPVHVACGGSSCAVQYLPRASTGYGAAKRNALSRVCSSLMGSKHDVCAERLMLC